MVTLKNNMYKNIASILASTNDDFKSSQNLLVIARILQAYPSKSLYYILSVRLLHYIEQNIKSIDLIIEVMKTEAEDEAILRGSKPDFIGINYYFSTCARAVVKSFDFDTSFFWASDECRVVSNPNLKKTEWMKRSE